MSKKSPAQRIDRLEQVVIGAAFLMQKLRCRYGADFGVGIDEQVNQFLRDARAIESARNQRMKSQASNKPNNVE